MCRYIKAASCLPKIRPKSGPVGPRAVKPNPCNKQTANGSQTGLSNEIPYTFRAQGAAKLPEANSMI